MRMLFQLFFTFKGDIGTRLERPGPACGPELARLPSGLKQELLGCRLSHI